MATLGRNRWTLYYVFIALCAFAQTSQAADAATECELIITGPGGAASALSNFTNSGIRCNCQPVAGGFENTVENDPNTQIFVDCGFAFNSEFDPEAGSSVTTACVAACQVNDVSIPDEDESPAPCEDYGYSTNANGSCNTSTPPPDGPTDEECQQGGGGVKRAKGGDPESAGAAYIGGDPVSEGGCSQQPSTAGGNPPDPNSPNEGDNATGPDYDPETPGVQNCWFSGSAENPEYTCDFYYSSDGREKPTDDPDILTDVPDGGIDQEYSDIIEHNDGGTTEIITARQNDQISPGINQEITTTTSTNKDENGDVEGSTEEERTVIRYDDGSVTETIRTTIRDALGDIVDVNISGSSNPGAIGISGPEELDENGNSASGIGDCAVPPSCNGDAILCEQNLAMWYEICGFENSTPAAIALADAVDGTGIVGEDFDVESTVTDLLNTAGFLSNRSCPGATTLGTSIGGSAAFSWVPMCDLAGYLSFLVLAFASFKSGKILLGGI